MAKSKGPYPGPQPQQLPHVQASAGMFGLGRPQGAFGAQAGALGSLGGLAQQQGGAFYGLGLQAMSQQQLQHITAMQMAFWYGQRPKKTGRERHEDAVRDLLDE